MSERKKDGKDRRSQARKDAERLYLESGGEKRPAEIAQELGMSSGQVRKWKSVDAWEQQLGLIPVESGGRGKNTPSRKAGAPFGNQNAKGAKGNPSPNPPPDQTKHGAYRNVYFDLLTDEEKRLCEEMPLDEEELLCQTLKQLKVQEYRITLAILKYRNDEKISSSLSEKVITEYAPGKNKDQSFVETHKTNNDLIMIRLEQELSTVSGKIIKAVEALHKIRMDRLGLEAVQSEGSIVEEWVAAVVQVNQANH